MLMSQVCLQPPRWGRRHPRALLMNPASRMDALISTLGEMDFKNTYNDHFALDLWPPSS